MQSPFRKKLAPAEALCPASGQAVYALLQLADWSWQQLTKEEQRLKRRCLVTMHHLPKCNHKTRYRRFYCHGYGKQSVGPAHRLLLTCNVLPGIGIKALPNNRICSANTLRMRCRSYSRRQWQSSLTLSKEEGGSEDLWTYAHCQEKGLYGQMLARGFAATGFDVYGNDSSNKDGGLAGCRKL